MTFSTYGFMFLFLPASLITFFTVAKYSPKHAMLSLSVLSLAFYATLGARHLPVLVASLCVNYCVLRGIESSSAKRFWLTAGLAFNVMLLAAYKLAGTLPPGISFWTFTQAAFLVEAFRGAVNSEGLAEYCVCSSFFPYVISGPVVNCREILPQLRSETLLRPSYDSIARGMTIFTIGLFKKVCFADMIAPSVNAFFADPEALSFGDAWIAALGYSVQLYFDFSGYSDMAIGVGLMFGLRLPENFASPYKSLSVIDFWRRWHISLGAWIRDYVYIPLGGSRCGELVRTRNVIVAMLFTGLWHGVGWTFVLWGLLHGLMLAVNHWWRKHGVRLPALVAWGMTFACVVLCWVVFRADSLGDALRLLRTMLDFGNFTLPSHNLRKTAGLLAIALFMPNSQQLLERFKPGIVWLSLSFMAASVSLANLSGVSDFLYFRF